MRYEIQKACLIPVFPTSVWRGGGKSPTQELWQVVDTAGDEEEAVQKFDRCLTFNKGKGIFYRLVQVHSNVVKA